MNRITRVHQQPLSRIVRTDDLSDLPATIVIEASADECLKLARRADIEACRSFCATATFAPSRGAGIELALRVQAEIVQVCGRTLDPLAVSIDETWPFLVVTRADRLAELAEREERDPLNGPDYVDLSCEDGFDCAELAVELFLLSIDPYLQSDEAGSAGATGATEADGGSPVLAATPSETPDPEREPQAGTRKPFVDLDRLLREKAAAKPDP